MSELSVRDVSIHYGTTPALDEFSLDVASGEIMAVVGPSGSGKSTLLRAVAGLEPLRSGAVRLAGRDLAGVPTHKRGLGLMFQDHGLFGHLSVADNIAYGLRIGGAAKDRQRERVSELLELVELEGFGGRGTGELSGGEAQRVALARALAPEPGLLMLDEPLGSLDRALRDQLTGDLRRMLTGLGQTALHVTHDQAEAFALADRVAVVSEGRPVAVGTPAELWADPGTRFVAEFLGHRNIWEVVVDERGAVSLGGQMVGVLDEGWDDGSLVPGKHLVVMPVTALRLARSNQKSPSGSSDDSPGERSLLVTVTGVAFRRGSHDVTAIVGPAEEATTVEFETTSALSVGDEVQLEVAVSEFRPLVDG